MANSIDSVIQKINQNLLKLNGITHDGNVVTDGFIEADVLGFQRGLNDFQ